MTIGELSMLLEEFRRLHPEAAESPVYLEGCDCWGEADGIKFSAGTKHDRIVLLTRSDRGDTA